MITALVLIILFLSGRLNVVDDEVHPGWYTFMGLEYSTEAALMLHLLAHPY